MGTNIKKLMEMAILNADPLAIAVGGFAEKALFTYNRWYSSAKMSGKLVSAKSARSVSFSATKFINPC